MDKSDLTRSEVIQVIAIRRSKKLPLYGVKFYDLTRIIYGRVNYSFSKSFLEFYKILR